MEQGKDNMTVQRPFKNDSISRREDILGFVGQLTKHLVSPPLNRLALSVRDNDKDDDAVNIVLKDENQTTTWEILFGENPSSLLMKEKSEKIIKITLRGLSHTKKETLEQDAWETKPVEEFKRYLLEFLYDKTMSHEKVAFAQFMTQNFPTLTPWSRDRRGKGHRSSLMDLST